MILLPLAVFAASIPSDVTEFDLSNGIHVISRTVQGGEVEGVSLFLLGGSRLLEEETQGIEAFALEAAMTGSEGFPDLRWREIMDITLAEWSASYNYDYSRYHLKCLSEDLPILLEGFSDCLLNPSLDSSAVSRVRGSQVSSVTTELEDPDNRIWLVANRGFMGKGHPYMLRPEGYPETLSGFTAEDARSWLERRIRAVNLLITHAGPTTPDSLRSLLEVTFGLVPPGGDSLPPVPGFFLGADTLCVEYDEVQTAYMVVKFPAPPGDHAEFAAYSVACGVIDELLWQVLRTDNALTYATYAGATGNYVRNWGYMYVSTPEPAVAAPLMVEVFNTVASGESDPSLFTDIASSRRTIGGIQAQSMATQCLMMGAGYITSGDWSAPYRLQEAYENVSPEEAARVLSDWADPAGWGIISDSVMAVGIEPLPLGRRP